MIDQSLAPEPSVAELRRQVAHLASVDDAEAGEADESVLIDHLTVLEHLKSAAAAAQARVTATLVTARTRAEAARGVPATRRCRGLANEIALARHDSPSQGGRHLGLATALVHEMPHTLAALTTGEISEWRATILVRETAILTRAHRTQVDTELAGQLTTLGDRAVAAAARTIGYRLDPGSAVRRTRGANKDRHVSLRPAPDTMTYLTGFLPVAQGVACKVELERHADSLRAGGDGRSRGQIMADTLVERVTGQASAPSVPVEIHLVMTDLALLAGDHGPAHLDDYGPLPAALARDLARGADRAWLRRLFTSPDASTLVAMDSRRRTFSGELRRFVITRDAFCRTPWCDAPIRHVDHVVAATEGGPTSADNAQGLCEACNQAKSATGWRARRLPGAAHTVETITPTGHRHRSRAPDPPRARPDFFTDAEQRLRRLLDAA